MRVPRRLVPLLACALIAGTPAVAHAQGGAGDDQYQDPFGGSGSGASSGGGGQSDSSGSGSSSSGSATQGSGSSSAPAQDPNAGASGSSSSSSSSSSAPAPAPSSSTTEATTSRSQLPRTGFDAPIVALLGIGLLAAGVGLRLRIAHGRRP